MASLVLHCYQYFPEFNSLQLHLFYLTVHGNWSYWASWSSCSKTCGGGKKFRTRLCDSPLPWNGGDDCKGKEIDQTACNTRKCSGKYLLATVYLIMQDKEVKLSKLRVVKIIMKMTEFTIYLTISSQI